LRAQAVGKDQPEEIEAREAPISSLLALTLDFLARARAAALTAVSELRALPNSNQ
jgi:hypothetical protein